MGRCDPTFPNNPKLAEEYNKIVSGILKVMEIKEI